MIRVHFRSRRLFRALSPTKVEVMNRRLITTVCMILLIGFPASAMRAAVGLVQPDGPVLLNGSALNQQSAIFNGDVIQTSAKAKAVISSSLLVASLAENSRMELNAGGIQLRSGVVVVQAERPANTMVAGTNILSNGGRFVVRHGSKKIQIAAITGGLRVVTGNQTVLVPVGKGLAVSNFDEDEAPRTAKRRNVGWLNNSDVATLVLIGSGVAAGVGIGLYNALKDDGNVSPSVP